MRAVKPKIGSMRAGGIIRLRSISCGQAINPGQCFREGYLTYCQPRAALRGPSDTSVMLGMACCFLACFCCLMLNDVMLQLVTP